MVNRTDRRRRAGADEFDRPVTRRELAVALERWSRHQRWYRRLWRWLGGR